MGDFTIDSPMNWLYAVLVAMGFFFASRPLAGEQLTLEIDSQSSTLTAAGYVPSLDVFVTSQDVNGDSLTTTFSGTITVDVDNLASPSTIGFISADAVAGISGNWLPALGGGTVGDPLIEGDADPGMPAPANYGFYLDAGVLGEFYSASRDSIFSLSSSPKTVTGGQFDPLGIDFTIPQGITETNTKSPLGDDVDTNDVSDESGINCTNEMGTVNSCGSLMGDYAVANDLITLTLPIDVLVGEGGDVEFTFTGTFVATASLAQPLPGDYNDDHVVDAADYALWRDLVGSSTMLPNDDIGGTIGPDHYTQWANNFGGMSGGGIGSAAVPEPATATLVSLGVIGLWLGRRSVRLQVPSANSER